MQRWRCDTASQSIGFHLGPTSTSKGRQRQLIDASVRKHRTIHSLGQASTKKCENSHKKYSGQCDTNIKNFDTASNFLDVAITFLDVPQPVFSISVSRCCVRSNLILSCMLCVHKSGQPSWPKCFTSPTSPKLPTLGRTHATSPVASRTRKFIMEHT